LGLVIPPHRFSPLFPYTTLFRSLYAAGMYINGMVAEAALKATGGKTDDKEALIAALRAVSLTDSPRGPFHFDHFGNVVGNTYVRSEEHTSQLQSLTNLPCPLLLA